MGDMSSVQRDKASRGYGYDMKMPGVSAARSTDKTSRGYGYDMKMPGVSAVRSSAEAYLLKSMRDICDDMCADGTAGSLCTCDTQPPARAKTLSPDEERRLKANRDASDYLVLKGMRDTR